MFSQDYWRVLSGSKKSGERQFGLARFSFFSPDAVWLS
jgi:hypothetical protein